jgi:chaperonin GroEL (HSP60 family)
MPKIMIHGNDARRALAHGVQKLSAAVESTLVPMGMDAIDQPGWGVNRLGNRIVRQVRKHGRAGGARSVDADQ